MKLPQMGKLRPFVKKFFYMFALKAKATSFCADGILNIRLYFNSMTQNI